MKILIACEQSGIVREAFKARGHDAWSCDILDTDIPGQHFKCDVLTLLEEGWDLMIAHPPCTHLACSGAKHFHKKQKEQADAINFFMALANAPINKICIENPVCIMSTVWRKPDQIIQPWQFGHEAQKRTCFWLKNLPPLKPTKIVSKGTFYVSPKGKKLPKWYSDNTSPKFRSKTFSGIAEAMAAQWG